jgi:hypothetical protein
MAGMVFSAKADFKELDQLRAKIVEVSKELSNMDINENPKGAKSLMKELQSLQREYQKQSEAAQIAVKQLEQLQQKYDAQGSTIVQLEKHIDVLTEKLKNSGKDVDSPEYKKLEDRLHALENAYEQLQQKQQQTVSAINRGASQVSGTASMFEKLPASLRNMFEGGEVSSQAFIKQMGLQREVLRKLELDYMNLRDKLSSMGKVMFMTDKSKSEYEKVKKSLVEVRSEINEQKKTIREVENAYSKMFGDSSQKAESFYTIQRKIREEMMSFRNPDGSISPENMARYDELKKKLQEVGTAYRLVRNEQKALTTAGTQIGGIVSGLSGVAGVFTATQGAMSLFTKDNEKLMAIQTKLQAAMSITMGLQAAANTMHQTSAFRLATVAKAQELWNGAITILNTRMGISIGLSKVFASAGIGLIIAAIAALVIAMQKWTNVQEKVKKTRQEAISSIQTEIATARSLEAVLKNSNNSYTARNEALIKLKELMPQYNAMLDKEGNLIDDNTESMKQYIEQLKNVALVKTYTDKLAQAQSAFEVWVENLSEREQNVLLSAQFGEVRPEDNFAYQILEKKRSALIEEIETYEKLLGIAQSRAFDGNQPEYDTKAYWEKQQKDAETMLATMKKAEEGSKRWNEAMRKYNEASEKLKAWDVDKKDDSGREADKRIAAQQSILNRERALRLEREKAELEARQKELDLEDDSFNKRMKQNKLNYDKELQAIKEFEAKKIEEQQKAAKDMYAEEKGTDMGFNFSSFDKSKLPEGLRDSDINKYVADATAAADKALVHANDETLRALLEQYQDYVTQRLALEKKYNDDIEAMNDKRTSGEDTSKIDAAIAEAEKQKNAALAKLDTDYKKSTTAISKLFSDMRKKSVADMRLIANEARAMLDFVISGDWTDELGQRFGITEAQFKQLREEWQKSPEALKAIVDAIEDVEDKAGKAGSVIDKFNNAAKKLTDAKETGSAEMYKEAIDELIAAGNEAGGVFNSAAKALGAFADATDNDRLKAFASTMQDVSENIAASFQGAQAGASVSGGNQWGAVAGAVIGGATSLMGIIAKYKQSRDELRTSVKDFQQQEYFGEYEVNRLWRDRYEWAQQIGETTLQHIRRQGEELARQRNANNTEQDKLWRDLQKQEYITGEHFEKTGLFGWGKGKVVQDTMKLAGKTWEEIEMLAGQGKLSEDGMKYYEALKMAKEEGEDIAARQEEYLEKVRETFTGTSYDSFVNSIIDGFKAGKRSAADFADTFEELMKGAVVSALKLSADGRIREFYETFADLANDGLTKDEIEYLRKLWDTMMNTLGEEAKNLEKVTGVKIGEAGDENTLKGAYGKASQESIDLLAGQTGAARRTLELILAELNESYVLPPDFISSIMGGMGAIPELIASGLHELIAIKDLNARIAASNDATAANTQRIGEISQHIEAIAGSVDGKLSSLADIASNTAGIDSIANNTEAAAGSLSKMGKGVNVNLKGL